VHHRTHECAEKNPKAPRKAPSRIRMPAVRAVAFHVNGLENGTDNIQISVLLGCGAMSLGVSINHPVTRRHRRQGHG